ncbi:Rpp14/Pop5 family protein [Calycina marina]|uniref:Ribonuclease P/MRP protein subunit POP5 n=1 Tax=Calycina marina TaxID=1763456 RepID=A0A9P8CF11_9HELO|nr:Rpp14/Pop5 family protein [Calycina marina]
MVRVKHRYLLVNILYPELLKAGRESSAKLPDAVTFHQPTTSGLNSRGLEKAIKHGVEELFGDYGYGAIRGSLQVKYLSTATSTFIIKVARDHYRMVWTALSFMTKVPGVHDAKPCVFRVIRVSGTIRESQEEAIRRAREQILAAQREQGEKSDLTLAGIFGPPGTKKDDVMMVDKGDGEEEGSNEG